MPKGLKKEESQSLRMSGQFQFKEIENKLTNSKRGHNPFVCQVNSNLEESVMWANASIASQSLRMSGQFQFRIALCFSGTSI